MVTISTCNIEIRDIRISQSYCTVAYRIVPYLSVPLPLAFLNACIITVFVPTVWSAILVSACYGSSMVQVVSLHSTGAQLIKRVFVFAALVNTWLVTNNGLTRLTRRNATCNVPIETRLIGRADTRRFAGVLHRSHVRARFQRCLLVGLYLHPIRSSLA